MPNYFVFLENARPDVAEKIKGVDENFFELSDCMYFFTSNLAAGQLAEILEVFKKEEQERADTGIVVEVGSDYAGHGPTVFWAWLKAALGE
ncbi:MAG: hypothetical protein OXG03_02770 [Gammaproteobacteria bacterium]|nr:hypothetical protein [Gammaproteobacteria bacterium]